VHFDDRMAAGSMPATKAARKVRMESKDYVMHDGDVVEFRLTCDFGAFALFRRGRGRDHYSPTTIDITSDLDDVNLPLVLQLHLF